MTRIAFLVIALACTAAAEAQLVEPNQIGVRMGHVHLAVRDVDAQRRFWTSVMGGRLINNGPLELIEFPGVYIMLSRTDSPESPAGSIVEHFGFIVRDMQAALAKWRSIGVGILPTENPNEVYLQAPDGIRVEVYGEPALPTAISMNHIHFYPTDIPSIKSWYVKAFGANPGRRPCIACLSKPRMIEADDLPGVNLSFSPGDKPPLPMKGRAIDHIGFEVDNLEALAQSLASQGIHLEGPIVEVAGSKIKVAFLTDPWGTRIELTQGLSPR